MRQEKVDPQKLAVIIKHIKRARNGDILLETRTGTGEPEKLKTAIVEAGEGLAKVLSKETRRVLMLVKDLEEDVSALKASAEPVVCAGTHQQDAGCKTPCRRRKY